VKKVYLAVFSMAVATTVQAQTYTMNELETQFLQNNYALIAQKFQIESAQAEIVQEKLWPNPTLSISEVNLWKTYQVEEQPFLFGKYGNNQQISVELEQLIETAGKRKKRVALKETEKNNAVFDFEELIRELKKELRQTYYTLDKIHREDVLLTDMLRLFTQMNEQYERQASLQNVPKASYYRIQTELMGLQKEKMELESQKSESLHRLRLLVGNSSLELSQLAFLQDLYVPRTIPFDLKDQARSQNIGLKKQQNEIDKAHKLLLLEKAQRIPDLTVQVNYDRGGNIMRDFVGIGISMDLPIFNTNKGAIKAAQFTVDQQYTQKQAIETALDNSISLYQSQLSTMALSLRNWSDSKFEEQAAMIDNYQKHLQNRQVTLMEFIDFTQAYRDARTAYLELLETYNHTIEELQYLVGKDF